MITMDFNSLNPNIAQDAVVRVSRKQINKYSVKSVLIKREFSGKG
jgi:hypothetical protein